MFDDELLKSRQIKPPQPRMRGIGQAARRMATIAQERSERRVGPRRYKNRPTTRRAKADRNTALPGLKRVTWNAESEAHFQQRVIKAAKLLGWKYVYHTFDSRRSPSGFPDLVMVHPSKQRLAFVELKSARGALTWAQTLWKVALQALPMVEYYTWKPADWDALVAVLRRA